MNAIPRLKPRRSPEPGRPFVNRGRELKLVQDKVEIGIQGKLIPLAITCFWGAFGMGKSWLLGELERRHRYTTSETRDSYPTIAARLDLDRTIVPILWRNDQLDRVQVVREIWKQLGSQLGGFVPDPGRASSDEWAKNFVEQVTAWSAKSATPIIMLDSVDDLVTCDEAAFFWLEEHVVERLAITDRVLFIFASRGELQRWRRWLVRRRVDSYRLTGFDTETAGQEVGANPDVSQVLFRHAFGHPLVTEHLGTTLEEQGVNLHKATQVEQIIDPSLVLGVLRGVIAEILKEVPEQSAELARYISVLRWVGVEPIRFLAEDSGIAEGKRGDAYYVDLTRELQAYHLLYWNRDKNYYEPDPVLRRLLAYFLELDEPLRFRAAHRAAFNFHGEHLSQYPQYLARYVPELMYHRAMLARCKLLEPQPPTFWAWWQQFLVDKAPTSPEPWAELIKALGEDKELRNALPAKDYERLCSESQKRADGTAG